MPPPKALSCTAPFYRVLLAMSLKSVFTKVGHKGWSQRLVTKVAQGSKYAYPTAGGSKYGMLRTLWPGFLTFFNCSMFFPKNVLSMSPSLYIAPR